MKKYLLSILLFIMAFPAFATVSTETTRVAYTCNGTSTTYAYTFKILADADLKVIKTLTATGAETTLTLATDYTVTGAGTASGNVVLTAGSKCASGYTMTILRDMDVTQETDYVDGEAFSAQSIEDALDKNTMILQQLKEEVGRAPKLPTTSTITDIALPNPTANHYIGWNTTGTNLTNISNPVATTATQYEIDALVTYGGGSSYTQATIDAALTAIGTTNKVTLLLRPGTWVISSNFYASSYTNVTFKFAAGAVLSHAAFTISMPTPDAGEYQIFSGTGTVTLTLGDRKASWWGFLSGATGAVNAAAIMSAHNSIGSGYGGTIKLPRGAFAVAADTVKISKKNVTIEGEGGGYAYEGGEAATQLTIGAGTYGIDMGITSATGNYGTIRKLKLIGSASVSYGIGIYGAQIVEDVESTGFNLAGIVVANGGNSTHLNRVSAGYNIGSGLLITEGATSTTTMSVRNSNFRRNETGIEILSGKHISFENCIIESNYGLGLKIYKPSVSVDVGNITFKTCWFENNGDTAEYQILISSYNTASLTLVPSYIHFEDCDIYAETGHLNVHVKEARFVTFKDCKLASVDGSSVVLGSYASYVRFLDGDMEQPSGYGNRSYWEEFDLSGTGGRRNYMGDMATFQSVRPSNWNVAGSDPGIGELRIGYSYGTANIEADASTTITVSPAIPTGAKVIGTQLRVDSALATGELWDAKYIVNGAGVPDAVVIATAQAVAKNTKVNTMFDVNVSSDLTTSTPCDVAITKNGGGNFTAQGTIAAWIYYERFVTVTDKP